MEKTNNNMKKTLVIGSTVVDVIINVDHLPRTQEDVHVITQRMSLGGCAYNTSDMIRHFQVPYILFSPVGTGAYGDFVRTELQKR
ncbi:MAG: PfkB family carbohydrate kinase, partial [Lachnospiraceae bacterium]|nr:PfkB family carbohydrate kinase [Lachnospiraceae bacterium]